jgi:DNA-binding response OmpR family regulator
MTRQVLIVDDDPSFRGALRTFLETEGHAALEAPNGSMAVEILKREQIDLILLDYYMPLWDGVETMLLLRKQGKFPPVLAYTAKTPENSQAFEMTMLALGAIEVIRCADGPGPLLASINRVLARPSLAPSPRT